MLRTFGHSLGWKPLKNYLILCLSLKETELWVCVILISYVCRKLLLYTTTVLKCPGVSHSVTWTLITHISDISKTNQKRSHERKCTQIPAAVTVWSLLDSDLAEQSLWLILAISLMTVVVRNEEGVCERVCKKEEQEVLCSLYDHGWV